MKNSHAVHMQHYNPDGMFTMFSFCDLSIGSSKNADLEFTTMWEKCTCKRCLQHKKSSLIQKGSAEEILTKIIDAWESLRGGRDYSPRDIENWLRNDMSPAINKARDLLGRKPS